MIKPIVLAAGMAAFAVPAVAESPAYSYRGFDTISADALVDVTVQQGPDYAIDVEGDHPDLKIRMRDDTLYISNEPGWFTWGLIDLLREDERASVTVTLPEIEEIKAKQSAKVSMTGGQGDELELKAAKGGDIRVSDLSYDEVEADVSTGGFITLSGSCGELEAEASTGARLDASRLVCAEVSAEASTGSELTLHGTQTAQLKASTGAVVRLDGGATVARATHSTGGAIYY